jgi:hypothetical protein
MTLPWFKLYNEFANDPKVQMMTEAMQRRLIMIFCLRSNETLETLHETELAFHLRIDETELQQTKQLFIKKGFIDDDWNVLNWEYRQQVVSTSTERVRKHRNKQKQQLNDNETHETLHETHETNSETLHETKCNVRLDVDVDVDVDQSRATARENEVEKLMDKVKIVFQTANEMHPTLFHDGSGTIQQWLNNGMDLEMDILPTIKALITKANSQGKTISKFGFFTNAIADAKVTRTATMATGQVKQSTATFIEPTITDDERNQRIFTNLTRKSQLMDLTDDEKIMLENAKSKIDKGNAA